MRRVGVLAIGMLCLRLCAVEGLASDIVGQASVIDGDTIEIHDVRVRLAGIDAFEAAQLCERDGKPWRCGQAAALALSDKLAKHTVRCLEDGRDRYGRTLAQCFVGQLDVNGWLVKRGMALAYRQFSMQYVPEEEAAKNKGAGAWAGDFEAPWEWRKTTKRR